MQPHCGRITHRQFLYLRKTSIGFAEKDDEMGSDWFDEEWVRKQLKIPENKEPPYGGIAKHIHMNPSLWRPLGAVLWQCALDGRDIYFQRFARDMIMGPFRAGPNDENGVIYTLFDNDHTWTKEAISTRPIKCKTLGWH